MAPVGLKAAPLKSGKGKISTKTRAEAKVNSIS